VFYAGAGPALAALAAARGLPVAETHAGKGALPADAPGALGAIGVTGSAAANQAARVADVIVGLGTRLQDFTTGSRRLFAADARLFQVNLALHDLAKHGAQPVLGDAGVVVAALAQALRGWTVPPGWAKASTGWARDWHGTVRAALDRPVPNGDLPDDVAVIGAVQRARPHATIVGAAGGLPGDLHRFWPCPAPGRYHVEYGYSCMGYELAGGMGVALARPEADVVVMVGDGSYLMLNAELASAVALGVGFTVVLVDNRGFGCIHRLQGRTGNASFATLRGGGIDFVAHARALGAEAHKMADVAALEAALRAPRAPDRPTVLVIETDPDGGRDLGGAWWDVAVPESAADDGEGMEQP
jgi:3D-(3,5/4)-trihydroxycyclohexane-1,2-dione acylhydrolase (decyclizing)